MVEIFYSKKRLCIPSYECVSCMTYYKMLIELLLGDGRVILRGFFVFGVRSDSLLIEPRRGFCEDYADLAL